MPRDRRDRRGRTLTAEQRKLLRERAKALKKRKRRKATPAEIMQIVFVVILIFGIVYVAFELAGA